jgi:pantetheine-phosphate adenylyltransferase
MKRVIVGGTFDLLHEGHKALLRKAFELGDVWIGLTSDEMAKSGRDRVVLGFDKRKKELENFITNELGKKAGIFEISDKFGSTLKEDFDYIVTSPQTYQTALIINQEREKIGKKPMEVVKVDYVFAQDGKPISSTRISNGEIDKEGKLLR